MKFAADVLLEIVNIVQTGLIQGTDISQKLREIDVEGTPHGTLRLSDEYLKRGENTDW